MAMYSLLLTFYFGEGCVQVVIECSSEELTQSFTSLRTNQYKTQKFHCKFTIQIQQIY